MLETPLSSDGSGYLVQRSECCCCARQVPRVAPAAAPERPGKRELRRLPSWRQRHAPPLPLPPAAHPALQHARLQSIPDRDRVAILVRAAVCSLLACGLVTPSA